MRKLTINLLSSRQDYRRADKFFGRLRYLAFFYSLGLVIVITALFVINNNLVNQVTALSAQKITLTQEVSQKASEETALVYISRKVGLIDEYLARDVKFEPYYNLFQNLLKETGSSYVLSSFALRADRSFTFAVSFPSLEETNKFLTYAESSDFLKHFGTLTLSNIRNQNRQDEETPGDYQLIFEGLFNPINADKN